jgi:hypothetical protein
LAFALEIFELDLAGENVARQLARVAWNIRHRDSPNVCRCILLARSGKLTPLLNAGPGFDRPHPAGYRHRFMLFRLRNSL